MEFIAINICSSEHSSLKNMSYFQRQQQAKIKFAQLKSISNWEDEIERIKILQLYVIHQELITCYK